MLRTYRQTRAGTRATVEWLSCLARPEGARRPVVPRVDEPSDGDDRHHLRSGIGQRRGEALRAGARGVRVVYDERPSPGEVEGGNLSGRRAGARPARLLSPRPPPRTPPGVLARAVPRISARGCVPPHDGRGRALDGTGTASTDAGPGSFSPRRQPRCRLKNLPIRRDRWACRRRRAPAEAAAL